MPYIKDKFVQKKKYFHDSIRTITGTKTGYGMGVKFRYCTREPTISQKL